MKSKWKHTFQSSSIQQRFHLRLIWSGKIDRGSKQVLEDRCKCHTFTWMWLYGPRWFQNRNLVICQLNTRWWVTWLEVIEVHPLNRITMSKHHPGTVFHLHLFYCILFHLLLDLIMCRRQAGIGERKSISLKTCRYWKAYLSDWTSMWEMWWQMVRLYYNRRRNYWLIWFFYSPVCDSYVRPETLVRICDECNFGTYGGRCIICGSPG